MGGSHVGGPSTGGLIWKRRGDPARTGLAPEPYRYFAAGAPAHPIILHCSWCVTPAIYPITNKGSNISNLKLAFTPAAGAPSRNHVNLQYSVTPHTDLKLTSNSAEPRLPPTERLVW